MPGKRRKKKEKYIDFPNLSPKRKAVKIERDGRFHTWFNIKIVPTLFSVYNTYSSEKKIEKSQKLVFINPGQNPKAVESERDNRSHNKSKTKSPPTRISRHETL